MARLLLTAAFALVVAGCSAAPASSTAAPAPTPGPSGPSPALATEGASLPATGSPSPGERPTWREVAAAGPSAREDHTWTADADGGLAYLFGGRDGATVFDDLWAYDLATDAWTQVPGAPGPAGRFGHEAAWVDGVGLVIFGGQAGSRFFDDLWAFSPDAGSWRLLPAAGEAPVARYGSCAAVGPDGRLWISHGFTADGSRFADTRGYDFASEAWSDETPDGAAPVERCLHGCWWTDDGAFTLYAGQTTGVTALGDRWRLSQGRWTEVRGVLPPDRNLYARARIDAATLVFGGQGVDGGYLDDAWLLADGASDATPLEITGPGPAARAGAEMVHDPARERVLLFGGRDADGSLADTWELRGALPAGG